jgi:hypothetical protein
VGRENKGPVSVATTKDDLSTLTESSEILSVWPAARHREIPFALIFALGNNDGTTSV